MGAPAFFLNQEPEVSSEALVEPDYEVLFEQSTNLYMILNKECEAFDRPQGNVLVLMLTFLSKT
jgi:hypothetical protein